MRSWSSLVMTQTQSWCKPSKPAIPGSNPGGRTIAIHGLQSNPARALSIIWNDQFFVAIRERIRNMSRQLQILDVKQHEIAGNVG